MYLLQVHVKSSSIFKVIRLPLFLIGDTPSMNVHGFCSYKIECNKLLKYEKLLQKLICLLRFKQSWRKILVRRVFYFFSKYSI